VVKAVDLQEIHLSKVGIELETYSAADAALASAFTGQQALANAKA